MESRLRCGLLIGQMIVLTGCGGSGIEEMPVASVTGVVQCKGAPIQGGIIFFEPKQTGESAKVGKTGMGRIDDQGRFTISTYGTEDGAVVGKHSVKVEKGDGPGCDCTMLVSKVVIEVDVEADGENNFTITLPEKTKRDALMERAEEDDDDEED